MELSPQLEAFIRGIPLFSRVERSDMLDLLGLLTQTTLRIDEVLFHEGDVGNGLWVLGPGTEVALAKVGPQGGSQPLATLGTGETVGELSLIDDGPRSATALVTRPGPAYRIEAVAFDVLREEMKPAAFRVMRKMAEDICARLRAVSRKLQGPGTAPPPPAPATAIVGERLQASTLDDFPPLKNTPATARLALAQKLTERTLGPGEVIFREGDVGDSCYMLVEGQVETQRTASNATVLEPGSLFGLVSVIDGGTRSATCIAKTPARIWRLGTADFDRLFAAGNRFAFRLVDLVAHQLAQNLRQANASLMEHAPSPSPELAELDLVLGDLEGLS